MSSDVRSWAEASILTIHLVNKRENDNVSAYVIIRMRVWALLVGIQGLEGNTTGDP